MSASSRVFLTSLALGLAALTAAHSMPELRGNDRADLPGAAVRVGTLHVGDGQVLSDVVIVIDAGRIVTVDPADGFDAARITHDLPGAVAAPGFVDSVTQLGLAGGAVEAAEALTPGVRAADAFEGGARALRPLAASGTTTIGLVPGPGNIAAGRAATASLRGDGARAQVTQRNGRATFAFMSPALTTSRVPSTLGGARRLLGLAFQGTRWETAAENPIPIRESALSELAALRGEPVLAWVDVADAAEVAADVFQERGLTPTFIGLRGAYGDADRFAELGAPCVVTSLSIEDDGRVLAIPGELARAGVQVALSTGAPARAATSLRMALALAVARGLPTEAAIPAVTHRPAVALGAEGAVGRVAAGLEADLIVFDGAPWELRSRVLLTFADGEVVADGRAPVAAKAKSKKRKGRGKR